MAGDCCPAPSQSSPSPKQAPPMPRASLVSLQHPRARSSTQHRMWEQELNWKPKQPRAPSLPEMRDARSPALLVEGNPTEAEGSDLPGPQTPALRRDRPRRQHCVNPALKIKYS